MTVAVVGDCIVLSGVASVEDAEPLLVALVDHPGHHIDVSGLTRAHLAVVQLLHAAGRPLTGQPRDDVLRDMALRPLIEPAP